MIEALSGPWPGPHHAGHPEPCRDRDESRAPLAPHQGRNRGCPAWDLAGAAHRHTRRGAAGLQRRGARPEPRGVRTGGARSTSPARRRTISARSSAAVERLHHGAGRRPVTPSSPGASSTSGSSLSPEGEVIHRHHKVVPLLPVEHSLTPHNVWDKWIELLRPEPRRVLPGRRHRNWPAGVPDGQRGLLPPRMRRGLAMNGAGGSCTAGPYPPSARRQRPVRDPEPRPRTRQQHVPDRRATSGTYYLHTDFGCPDRHVRRAGRR